MANSVKCSRESRRKKTENIPFVSAIKKALVTLEREVSVEE